METSSLSELLEFDKNYLDRITLRKQIIQDHHSIAIQSDLSVIPALNELYTFLISNYLPTRYPTIFTLSPTTLLNTVTNEHLPLNPPVNPIHTFEILGQNIDDDFLLLLPSEDGDGYCLKGYVTCFPAGFNTKEKFGMKLREIHGPVPGYKAKLEKSMDRFFDKLEVGKVVKRSNVHPPPIPFNPSLFSHTGGKLDQANNHLKVVNQHISPTLRPQRHPPLCRSTHPD